MQFSIRSLLALTLLVSCGIGACLWSERKSRRISAVMNRQEMKYCLRDIGLALQSHTIKHRVHEWKDFREALSVLTRNEIAEIKRNWNGYGPNSDVPPIEKGIDFWGSKIVMLKSEERFEYTLRSLGPNCVDDHGGEDDIDVSAVFIFNWGIEES